MFNLQSLLKLKSRFSTNEKKKYYKSSTFQKLRLRQKFWLSQQKRKRTKKKFFGRVFLRFYRNKFKQNSSPYSFVFKKKSILTSASRYKINYTSTAIVSKQNLYQKTNALNLFTNRQIFKNFLINPYNCFTPFLIMNSTSTPFLKPNHYFLTNYTALTSNAFHFYKNNSNTISLTLSSTTSSSLTLLYTQPLNFNFRPHLITKQENFFNKLALIRYFTRQSQINKQTPDNVTRFFPKGITKAFARNYYILNRTSKSVNLKGGLLLNLAFKKSLLTVQNLQSLVINENYLEGSFNYSNSTNSPILQKCKTLIKNNRWKTLSKRRFYRWHKKFVKKGLKRALKKTLRKRHTKEMFKLILPKAAKSLKQVNQQIKKKVLKFLNPFLALSHTRAVLKKSLSLKLNTFENSSLNTSYDCFFKNTNLLTYVFANSLLFKYIFATNLVNSKINSSTLMLTLNNSLFSTENSPLIRSNVLQFYKFDYQLKRRVLKAFTYDTFSPDVTMWYYHTIVRFIENCTGKKVYLKFNPFIENSLTFNDLSRCYIWSRRVVRFRKVLGARMFLRESLQIINLAIRFRDPMFLANWIRAMLKRTNFYKFKPLFRYLKYVFTHLFQLYFPEFGFKGIKLKLKGKICVAGNARTRTLFYRIGNTSHSTFDNRVIYDLSYINTFTGVLGFQLWFYY